ncbi:MAG: flagellar biosynthesis protein FlhB [Candidatus Omnitrophota bacterium]|nr:MAG: flagellar biosynthesis protein FlhB [Candidatus Omnitrophota bacterium]
MADNDQEKTEQASPRKRREAIEKGNLATSQELNSIVLLLAGMLFLSYYGKGIVSELTLLMSAIFMNLGHIDVSASAVASYLPGLGFVFFRILGPFLILLVSVAIIINIAQHGVVFTLTPLLPQTNLPHLNPFSGLKNIFSMKAAMRFVFSVMKMLIVVRACYSLIVQAMPQIMLLPEMGVPEIASFAGMLFFKLIAKIYFFLLIVALIDYAYQKWEYEKSLKMTKKEVKDELKNMEGNPQIKSRIRSMQAQMARKRMMQQVPEADVVITNPTHLAVAIKYDLQKMDAPKVVAKGARILAEKIKAIALENGVAIVENKPLARAIFKEVEVGEAIPVKLYQAVAEVLAYVFQLNKQKLQANNLL